MLLRSDIERLEKLSRYISEHLDQRLHIDDLSVRFGLGSSTLRRQFQQHFGIAVYRYITIQRMERARSLLEDCTYTINEISAQVGYSEPSNFTHAFCRYFGKPPSSYRK